MSSIAISIIVLVCVFGGAMAGVLLRSILPPQHLSADSKDIVRLGMGLVGTMAALVLGLLVASAKGSYDAQSNELTQMSANVGMLDRVLAHYGPETKDARAALRAVTVHTASQMWSKDQASPSGMQTTGRGEGLYDAIQQLSPQDTLHRSLQAEAITLANGLGETRFLMYEQGATSVPVPLLAVLILWLTMIFISFGVFAPRNATVLASLFVSALSVSCAILLILEMYKPFAGLIQISDAPLRAALAQLGQ